MMAENHFLFYFSVVQQFVLGSPGCCFSPGFARANAFSWQVCRDLVGTGCQLLPWADRAMSPAASPGLYMGCLSHGPQEWREWAGLGCKHFLSLYLCHAFFF